MLSEEYNRKVLQDFEKLCKTAGAAQELADRGWKDEVWCDDSYKEVIEDLYVEYLPEEFEDFVCIKVDDYLEVEDKLMKYLRNEVFALMR